MIQDIHQEILKSYREFKEKRVLRINATQLKTWSTCREQHRMEYLLGMGAVEPSIHYQFGSVIHKMAEGYWSGKPYAEAFHAALEVAQQLDIRTINAKDMAKWSSMQDTIAMITTLYYGHHGDKAALSPPILNESVIEWEWGTYAGIRVICNGIIDRLQQDGTLVDTKTASDMGKKEWRADLKKRLLREPQMGFYLRYLEHNWLRQLQMGTGTDGLGKVKKIEYEIIVKGYRDRDPYIDPKPLDVTDEVMSFQETFIQQMDWQIKELCTFYANCLDAQPWPMSSTACVGMFGECDYLPVCLGKESLDNPKLYRIKSEKEIEV